MESPARRKLERALSRISDDDVIDALDNEVRHVQMNVRISPTQREQIQEIASALNISASEYLLTLHALAVPRLRIAMKATKRR